MTKDDGNTFTCWKEIAAYLGKGVRTVQRWERQFGLPVQRPNARSKGIVRATRKELDEWMRSDWSRRAMKTKKAGETEFSETAAAISVAALREQQASIEALLYRFNECLRRLNQHCEELRGIVHHKSKDEQRQAHAA